MLEKPELKDEKIIKCLQKEYGLTVERIDFLPLGADQDTAVYLVETNRGTTYFLKLRGGKFDEAGVTVPKYLYDHDIQQIIPPLATATGKLWAGLAPYKAILYPYVEGHNAYEKKLSHRLWLELGAALKKLHTTDIPQAITSSIPKENFSPKWRDKVKMHLAQIGQVTLIDPIAVELAAFLKTKTNETLRLVERAERLAQELQNQPLDFVLCHADIHGWNLLIDKHDALYLVDWDTLIFAPRERDLMFIGCGLGDSGVPPQEEETLFYQGYGQVENDQAAIAYYRYERIIEDIAVFCDQIFSSDGGGEDRKQALEYLKSNFLPNNTIERALQSGKSLK
jgi:spectinomycin phosphotransferase